MDDTVIIEITQSVQTQRSVIEQLKTITKPMQKYLLALIDVSFEIEPDKDGNVLVGRKRLQAYMKAKKQGASDSSISLRLSELKKLGLCVLTVHTQPGRKRLSHFEIKDLAGLAGLTEIKQADSSSKNKRRVTKEIVHVQKEIFRQDESSLLLADPNNIVLFHEQFFNGILDTGMRISGKDKRTEITVEYEVAKKPLKITSSCSTKAGSEIAVLSDQRAMRNIISFCRSEIQKRKFQLENEFGRDYDVSKIPNLFHLDIHDLCKLMNMTTGNNSLDNVVSMMNRLADTKWSVDASKNPWFQEHFSMLYRNTGVKSDYFEFQFINNLEIANYNSKIEDLFQADISELRPRFYTFALEQRLFLTLIAETSTNLFLSHPGLSSERSGIIQRFYNWARAFISGRHKPGVDEKWYSIMDMHARLTPAIRLDNFRTYFLQALKRFDVDGSWETGKSGKALVYGYYVYYKRGNGTDLFQFERDPSDEIVGNNSRHNQLLRQSAHLDYFGSPEDHMENSEYVEADTDFIEMEVTDV